MSRRSINWSKAERRREKTREVRRKNYNTKPLGVSPHRKILISEANAFMRWRKGRSAPG